MPDQAFDDAATFSSKLSKPGPVEGLDGRLRVWRIYCTVLSTRTSVRNGKGLRKKEEREKGTGTLVDSQTGGLATSTRDLYNYEIKRTNWKSDNVY
jgi:hypothetical protein